MLEVKKVRKSFEGFMAVKNATLTVNKGEVTAVIGPNGAGKTTLFNLITGQLKPDRGEILFKGENIAGESPSKICRKGLGRSFQIVNIFSQLTVFDNVRVAVLARRGQCFNLFSPAKNLAKRETEEILESFGLHTKANRISGSLSHGNQKVLEMAIALGARPDMLILDEPTAGMSHEETSGAIDLIKRLSGDMGITILLCEHDMELVFEVSHRIMVMRQGESIAQDEPDKVRNNEIVKEAYLGGGN